jgi:succinoglycan biosynthesis protein ExoM
MLSDSIEKNKDHVSVCICTYRRNEMLTRLIKNLAIQETFGKFDFSIVVVDNDESGPARKTVEKLREGLGLDITYGIEKERTIPAARNNAIRLARGNYIGIIDDDEFPPQHWLSTMYKAIQTFEVEGALGPVHPFFESEPPSWLIRGRFCERPFYRTGTILRWDQTRTGNVLLKREVFEKQNLRFDTKWKTSGSDRAFFREAMLVGLRFIAVEEAPVYEIVPPDRWKKMYYLKRAIVHGFNAYQYNLNQKHILSKAKVFFKSVCAIFVYALLLPFWACVGSHSVMKYMEKGVYHLSTLLAMFGIELIKKRNF